MGKSNKKGAKNMDTDDAPSYNYGAAANSGVSKKKRRLKLSRKQLQRKERSKARGESRNDIRNKKHERDQRRMDQKLAAKGLW